MTRLLVSTVVRGAPLSEGGRLLHIDLTGERLLNWVPVYPSQPDVADAGRRGNARGGRGIVCIGNDRYVVADYHTLRVVRSDLHEEGRVSTPRMAGLHELAMKDGHVLATATTLDAVLEVDLDAGRELAIYEPRSWPSVMRELAMGACAPVDMTVDHRVSHIRDEPTQRSNHLHLNAVSVNDGRCLGFLNRPGVIVDLEGRSIVRHDMSLRGSHNLVSYLGDLMVNSSRTGELVRVPLRGGDAHRLALRDEANLDRTLRRAFARYWVQRLVGFLLPRLVPASRPFFNRGLVVEGARAYVGTSPAGIIELDLLREKVLRSWFFSTDVRECVHGLCIVA